LRINIPLEPVAKGRPKFGRGHAYTPEKTATFEEEVRWYLKNAILSSTGRGYKNLIKKPTPVKVSITFYLTQPKRSKYDYPIGKPDLSNLVKACEDSMIGILLDDDSQIVSLTAEKKWANEGSIALEVQRDD